MKRVIFGLGFLLSLGAAIYLTITPGTPTGSGAAFAVLAIILANGVA